MPRPSAQLYRILCQYKVLVEETQREDNRFVPLKKEENPTAALRKNNRRSHLYEVAQTETRQFGAAAQYFQIAVWDP